MDKFNSNEKSKSSFIYLIIFFIYTAGVITLIITFGKENMYLFLPKMNEKILYYSFLENGFGTFFSLIFGIIIYMVGLVIIFNIVEKIMSFKKLLIILLFSILGLLFVLKSSYTLITPTKIIYKDLLITKTYEMKNTDAIKIFLNYSGKSKDIKNIQISLIFKNKDINLNSGFGNNLNLDEMVKTLKNQTNLDIKNIEKKYKINNEVITYEESLNILDEYNEPYYKNTIIDLNK